MTPPVGNPPDPPSEIGLLTKVTGFGRVRALATNCTPDLPFIADTDLVTVTAYGQSDDGLHLACWIRCNKHELGIGFAKYLRRDDFLALADVELLLQESPSDASSIVAVESLASQHVDPRLDVADWAEDLIHWWSHGAPVRTTFNFALVVEHQWAIASRELRLLQDLIGDQSWVTRHVRSLILELLGTIAWKFREG